MKLGLSLHNTRPRFGNAEEAKEKKVEAPPRPVALDQADGWESRAKSPFGSGRDSSFFYMGAIGLREKALGSDHQSVLDTVRNAARSCDRFEEKPVKLALLEYLQDNSEAKTNPSAKDLPVESLAGRLQTQAFNHYLTRKPEEMPKADKAFEALVTYLETKEGEDSIQLVGEGTISEGPLHWWTRTKAELGRFDSAIHIAKRNLNLIQKHFKADKPEENRRIAEAHYLLGQQQLSFIRYEATNPAVDYGDLVKENDAKAAEDNLKKAYDIYHGNRVAKGEKKAWAQESSIKKDILKLYFATRQPLKLAKAFFTLKG